MCIFAFLFSDLLVAPLLAYTTGRFGMKFLAVCCLFCFISPSLASQSPSITPARATGATVTGPVTLLRAADFARGTYRIRSSGVYRLAEDISFNPRPTEGWLPSQAELRNPESEYPGAPTGPYDLGFFAAITVEADDVVIDLAGHTLAQSAEHNLQQRFYAHVELASSPFVPRQGPANFGSAFVAPRRVTLRGPGALGASSHHGVHGSDGEDALIANFDCVEWEVACIALNGFKKARVEKVVARARKDVPIRPSYSGAFFAKLFLAQLINRAPDQEFQVMGATAGAPPRTLTPRGVMADLNTAMDAAFDDVVRKGVAPGSTYAPAGIFAMKGGPNSVDGTAYGLIFHPRGVAINGLLTTRDNALGNEDIIVEDCDISVSARVTEVLGVTFEGRRLNGPAGDTFEFLEQCMTEEGRYSGNVYCDAQIILAAVGDPSNRAEVGRTHIPSQFLDWVKDPSSPSWFEVAPPLRYPVGWEAPPAPNAANRNEAFGYQLAGDFMNHVAKGSFGVRIDGGVRIALRNTLIREVENKGAPGNGDLIGVYEKSHGAQAQTGYPGTWARGICISATDGVTLSGVTFGTITSWHGPVAAVASKFGSTNVVVDGFEATFAGVHLRPNVKSTPPPPNAQPEARRTTVDTGASAIQGAEGDTNCNRGSLNPRSLPRNRGAQTIRVQPPCGRSSPPPSGSRWYGVRRSGLPQGLGEGATLALTDEQISEFSEGGQHDFQVFFAARDGTEVLAASEMIATTDADTPVVAPVVAPVPPISTVTTVGGGGGSGSLTVPQESPTSGSNNGDANNSQGGSSGLGAGAIVGISLGAVALLILLVAAGAFAYRKYQSGGDPYADTKMPVYGAPQQQQHQAMQMDIFGHMAPPNSPHALV